jgi:hypothetical protein
MATCATCGYAGPFRSRLVGFSCWSCFSSFPARECPDFPICPNCADSQLDVMEKKVCPRCGALEQL